MQAFGERGEGNHGHPATGGGTGGGNGGNGGGTGGGSNPGIPGQSSHLLTTE